MKPPNISPNQIRPLTPCGEVVVPESYRDSNGHMNMRWYSALFDQAGDTFFEQVGLTPAYHRQRGTGGFDLEHHIHFLREVLPGDRLTFYLRVIGRSAKRLHYCLFMVNETRSTLAASFECVNAFADLTVRKTAPYPGEVAARLDALLLAHAALPWAPPICGVMKA
ncbi:MAG TPA: thioesterase family protein [Candidatus Baltobacteraceae bacterium]|nr:thioesterase family protein [Candidatus Baltobacteraceae bacterium]